MKILFVFILFWCYFSMFAQKGTAAFSVLPMKDSLFIVFIRGDSVVPFQSTMVVANGASEIDSLKKGWIPIRFTDSLNRDTLVNRAKRAQVEFERAKNRLINTPVPDFDAPDTEGVLHRPAAYRGRVVLLHFWNFWDESFNQELPVLKDIYRRYHSRGLQVLSIVDVLLTDAEKQKLAKHPLSFPLVEYGRDFMRNFLKIRKSTPYLVVVDRQGKMRYLYINHELQSTRSEFYRPDGKSDFEQKIEVLLSEN
jgi:peroxiredoxin